MLFLSVVRRGERHGGCIGCPRGAGFGAVAEGFAGELTRQGYTVQTSRQQLGLVAHLSRWMSEQRIGVAELTPLVVER